MSLNFDNIPKYVINLDIRKDRWYSFQNTKGFSDLNNLKRFSAIDGNTINVENDERISVFTRMNIIKGVPRRSHNELDTNGGIGCYLSHIAVWQDFLKNSNSDVAFIFEDDAILNISAIQNIKMFLEKSKTIQNTELWDICILAPYVNSIKQGSIHHDDPYCLKLIHFSGLIGYMITKKGIKKILPLMFPIQGHIDFFLSSCAQLKYVTICCPLNNLINFRRTKSSITNDDCKICNITSDNDIYSNWRLNMLQVEEIILYTLVLFLVFKHIKKN